MLEFGTDLDQVFGICGNHLYGLYPFAMCISEGNDMVVVIPVRITLHKKFKHLRGEFLEIYDNALQTIHNHMFKR
jgi:hypothetical protein